MRAPTANLSATSLLIVGLLAAAPSAAVLPWTGARTFQQAPKALSGDWTADTRQSWTGDDGQPRVQFNLRTEAGDSRWGFGIRAGDLQGLPAAALSGVASDVRFTWTREAGTFRFSGSFDNGRGAGRYTFEPSSAFLSTMSGLGYRSLTGEDALRLAVIDVTSAYVRDLGQAGYRDLPLEQLTRMRIHKVMPEYIGEMKRSATRRCRPTTWCGCASTASSRTTPREKSLGTPPNRMRIHRVEPDFVRGLRTRGYSGLTAEDLVKMRIHKVSLEDIDQYKALGLGGLGTEDLVRFRIHRVTPAFVREMRDVGFASLTEEQLVRMRIHKVDAQFIKDARADGYAMTTPSDAVDLAIRGPRYTRARKQ